MKICTQCKLNKDYSEYGLRPERKCGYRSECNTCLSARCKRYREQNLAAINAKATTRKIDFKYRLFRSCKHSSTRRGIEFTITKEDIPDNQYCPYLGIKFTNIIGESFQDYNPSLDRIDNTKGYIPGNIQLISVLANRMKSTATIEQLKMFAEGIVRQHCL